MSIYTDKATRTLKLQKAEKPKIGNGLPPSMDGFEGENRIQMVEGKPRLYYRTNNAWYFTGLSQDGTTPDIPTATSTRLGLIKIGDGGTVSSDGTYTATAATPAADDITGGDAAVTISTSSGNITIDAAANNSNIIFKGTDATSDITMLTLSGADAGAATFNNKIVATELDISGNVDVDGTLETDALTINGTTSVAFESADHSKLDAIEASADVTDTSNVTSAGALMDSEVDADIKTLSLPASTTISAYGKSLIDDADASTARTTLGLGTAATASSGSFFASDGTLNIATNVTGTLAVGNGGTGATTLNNLITLSTHTTGNYVATLTAGNLIDLQNNSGEGATPTIDVDLTEASEATIANGDYILFLDGGATGATKKEALADLVGLMAGGNLSASGIEISVDSGDFAAADHNQNLATAVTGTLAVGNGGTGATTLNNLITLGTHTTGNYVTNIAAGAGIDVSGGGSETATVTITAEDSAADNKGAVIVAGGTNCSVGYSSGTATVNVSTTAYKLFDDVESPALGGTGVSSTTAYKNVLDDETWTFANATTFSENVNIAATKKLYLDGGSNTYIQEVAGDDIDIVTAGSAAIEIRGNVTEFQGTIRGVADIVAYYSSDPSLKENKKLISNPLDKIDSIGGYSFDWKEDAIKKVGDDYKHLVGKDYGVMADEIEVLFPELVNTRSNGIRAVKYDKLVPLLIEGIKELKHELDIIKGIS
ncbi:tail fiber domain-containing protein [bacterium]|nr:tail fiber domain-containing protein [bacterium]